MSSSTTAVTGIAGRYASALFSLAEEQNALDPVAADLVNIQSLFDQSEDLVRMVRSPVLDRDAQSRAMDAVLAKAGVSDLTRKFVGVAARNRRLFALPAMIRAFLDVMAERKGELTARVLSAKALSGPQEKALSEALKKAVGGKVAVEISVDPGLLGGLVVQVGSRMVDSSLRTKLSQLRLAMKGA